MFCVYLGHIQNSHPVMIASQQKQNICITFIQRRPSVFDVGPTLYKCYTNVLCLLVLPSAVATEVIACRWQDFFYEK